jgi:hypothetical protein
MKRNADIAGRDFRTIVVERARRDPAFRCALLREAWLALNEGDVDGCAVLLDELSEAKIETVEKS